MSTAYGINGATCWINVGTPNDSADYSAAGTAGYNVTSTVESNSAGSLAQFGSNVYGVKDAISGNYATQTTAANQPIYAPFGGWGAGDGSQACIKFPNYHGAGGTPGSIAEQMSAGAGVAASNFFLNLPTSCSIGGGAVAGEATIFIAGRFGLLSSGPFIIGNIAGTCTAITNSNNGSYDANSACCITRITGNHAQTAFVEPFIWPNLSPCVICLRGAQASGVIGNKQIDLFIGTTFQVTAPNAQLFPANATVTGGLLGSLSSSSGGALDCEIAEFLVFNVALSNANVLQIIQTMQDKICGGYSNQDFILFFGDSRTRGNNAQFQIDPLNRAWPKRCLNQLGGSATGMNMALIGDTVGSQTARLVNTYSRSNSAPNYAAVLQNIMANNSFGKAVACGEVGINDIFFNGQTAAQVEASLTTLYTALIDHGASTVVAMTIPPPAVGTVFAGTTWTTAMNNTLASVNAWIKNTAPGLIPGVVCCDNASDPRWSNPGYIGADGLHPDDPGYGVYAQNAARTLADVLNGAAAPANANLTFGNFPGGGQSLTYGSFR
jgi:lysophospholipase L1-like esterase